VSHDASSNSSTHDSCRDHQSRIPLLHYSSKNHFPHLLVAFHFDGNRPRDFARLFNLNGHLYWDRASLFFTSIPLYLHRNVERSNNTNAVRLFNCNDLCCVCGQRALGQYRHPARFSSSLRRHYLVCEKLLAKAFRRTHCHVGESLGEQIPNLALFLRFADSHRFPCEDNSDLQLHGLRIC
jgi:hypothetical protein